MSSACASEAFESESTMRDLIESGRQARENAIKKYEHALKLFAKAMNNCPCARGLQRRRCTCKNFDTVAAEGGSTCREATYACHCDVGETFSKCDNVDHIQALDLQATTFEALGKLNHAAKNAERILQLAPQLPDGHIPPGKIERLQKNDKYACELYAAGIEVNKEIATDLSPKSQQLDTLYRRVSRPDPVCLPAEIVSDIFSYLSWIELLRILRVSKEWTCKLTSPIHRKLWENVDFPDLYCNPQPHPNHLKKILSWAGEGGAKKIVINDCSDITEPTLTQLLESSPSLEYLEIHWMIPQGLPARKNKWTQLRHVSLSGQRDFIYKEVDCEGGFPQTFLQNAASSLEHLNFVGIPNQWHRGMVPHLPQLKTLHIGGLPEDSNRPSIFSLSVAFPRLEQLWIGPDIPFLVPDRELIRRTKWGDIWPHLKVLKFHDWEPEETEINQMLELDKLEDEIEETRETLRYLVALNSLQHISLTLEGENWPCQFRQKDEDLLSDIDVAKYSDFRNLRSFESPSFSITPDGGRILLSNAIMAKQLTSLDLVFPMEHYASPFMRMDSFTGGISFGGPDPLEDSYTLGEKNVSYLRGYEWLRGTPSIHTLGIYGFRFPMDAENNEGSLLPQFLATFPNLRTLKINSWKYRKPDFVSLVISIMRVTHLKTIYTTCVEDEFLDQLRETAQEHGVQLMSKFPEQQWPMPLES